VAARQKVVRRHRCTHGNDLPHGKEVAARQSLLARQPPSRTAKAWLTATRCNESLARQRPLPCKVAMRTATSPLPSNSLPVTCCRACSRARTAKALPCIQVPLPCNVPHVNAFFSTDREFKAYHARVTLRAHTSQELEVY
jgi:hypothetical protein